MSDEDEALRSLEASLTDVDLGTPEDIVDFTTLSDLDLIEVRRTLEAILLQRRAVLAERRGDATDADREIHSRLAAANLVMRRRGLL